MLVAGLLMRVLRRRGLRMLPAAWQFCRRGTIGAKIELVTNSPTGRHCPRRSNHTIAGVAFANLAAREPGSPGDDELSRPGV
jgi:hypothetical protein